MAESILAGTVEVAAATEVADPILDPELVPLKTERDRPFRVLILGDFAGPDRSASRTFSFDRSGLGNVFRCLKPKLKLDTETGYPLPLHFEHLADFEPDKLFRQLEHLQLQQQQQPWADGERTNLIRAILHHPRFQAVEAVWRGLDFLITRLTTHQNLEFHLLDVSKEELFSKLLWSPDFRSSDIYRIVVEESLLANQNPWTLLVGNFDFDRSSADEVELLERLGLLARAAGAPFLAEALPLEHGERDADRSWNVLRRSTNAGWIGLAMPRILLRSPYATDASTANGFSFLEFDEIPSHSNYLWGNPAFACAYLLIDAFLAYGWDFTPLPMQPVEELPFHVCHTRTGVHNQPCAEILLTDRDCQSLLEQGLIPIASVKDSNSVRLVKFQSIAEPYAPLSGRWLR